MLNLTCACLAALISLASVFPPADPARLVTDINSQCGYEFAVVAARRRWAGRPPIALSELRTIPDGFVANGFDAALYREI